MIQKLILEDFQAHKYTEIDFSKKVTSIMGINNQGKTSIFRALWKIIRDEPDGQSFIRNKPTQQSQTKITLITDFGKVTRIVRNDSSSRGNMYIVENPDLDDKPITFAKFGKTGIPEEVLLTLGISSPIDFGGIEYDINFSLQGDLLFLMQGQGLPSIRGKVLGKIIQIDCGARAIQLLSGDEKRVVQEIKRQESDLEKLNKDLEKYNDLDKFKKLWNESKKEYDRYIFQETEIVELENKLTLLQELRKRASKYVDLRNLVDSSDFNVQSERLTNLQDSIKLLESARDLKRDMEISHGFSSIHKEVKTITFDRVKDLIDIVSYSQSAINLSRELRILDSIKEVKIPSLEEIKSIKESIDTLLKIHTDIVAKGGRLQKLETDIEQYKVKEAEVVNSLEKLKVELKICPTCLQPFKGAIDGK